MPACGLRQGRDLLVWGLVSLSLSVGRGTHPTGSEGKGVVEQGVGVGKPQALCRSLCSGMKVKREAKLAVKQAQDGEQDSEAEGQGSEGPGQLGTQDGRA